MLYRDDAAYKDRYNYRYTPGSDCFSRVGYCESTQTLFVSFRTTGDYHYFDFPVEEYNSFMSAESLGNYHAKYIKGHYKYEKIDYDDYYEDYYDAHDYLIDMEIPDACIDDYYEYVRDREGENYNENWDYSDGLEDFYSDWIYDHWVYFEDEHYFDYDDRDWAA